MLTFRDSNISFKLDGGLLETITNYDLNVNHANTQDKKLKCEFGKELKFDIKQTERKSNRYKPLIKILKSPAIMASGISTKFLPSDPHELCDKFNLLLKKKQAGKNFIIINEEIVAILDNFLENKCIITKQHKQILIKCNLFHTTRK